jgi:hypothetical protein
MSSLIRATNISDQYCLTTERLFSTSDSISARSRTIPLQTLGRNGTDIIAEGSSIGRVRCSIEIEVDSRAVMLYDRSNGQTTQVFGENATPFENGRPRRFLLRLEFGIPSFSHRKSEIVVIDCIATLAR